MGNSFYSNATNGLGCGESGVDDEGAFGCSIRFHDEVHTTPYIIGVASLKATGVKSSYSTTDPSIWISGFGGEFGYNEDYRTGLVERAYEPAMITTDQSGCTAGYVSWYYLPRNRYNDWGYYNSPLDENSECNYTSTFNGTSAAAPSVAGGIAVLLGAYPNLTWRDVKHIMANTARKNDSTRSYSRNGLEQYNWNLNAAGYSHHYWYGFGAFDLGAAIDFASTYTIGSLGTFNEYGWEESEPIEVIEVSVEANANGSGNVYVIDGTQKKSLTLNVGATYIFNHPSAHPLRFSTTDDGTHGGGVEYTNGVTTSDGVTTIEVKEAPITLYYYCDVHAGMGSNVSNIDEKRNVNLLLPSYTSVENKITYSVETTGDFVEFIQVKIYLDKDTPRDIGLHLISPQGTEKSILHPFSNVSGNPSGEWFIMGVAGFYGENINGDWSLKVTDYTDNDDVGTLIDWGINVFGN
jgi:subtilisin-like proprotein convertase family protein